MFLSKTLTYALLLVKTLTYAPLLVKTTVLDFKNKLIYFIGYCLTLPRAKLMEPKFQLIKFLLK